MKTVKLIAKELRVNPSTLAIRLLDAGIEPTKRKDVDGVLVKQYDAAAFRRIVKYLKDDPIGKKPGPKRGSRRSGKAKR